MAQLTVSEATDPADIVDPATTAAIGPTTAPTIQIPQEEPLSPRGSLAGQRLGN